MVLFASTAPSFALGKGMDRRPASQGDFSIGPTNILRWAAPATRNRITELLSGRPTGAAALAAAALAPAAVDAWFAGHRSVEPGAAATLAGLGLRPLLDLDLRLGEGSGALLALPLVQAAARVLAGMATFDSAGVSEKA